MFQNSLPYNYIYKILLRHSLKNLIAFTNAFSIVFIYFFYVFVVSNIALDGEAKQINDRYYDPYYPRNAIDGNKTTYSHTNNLDKNANPWWEVKLPRTAEIYEVVLYPRESSDVPNRFRNGTLSVRNETGDQEVKLAINMDLYKVHSKRVECMVIGKILKIQLFRETQTYLHLWEVQIYGKYLEEVSL